VDGNPARRKPARQTALLGRCDLNGEQVGEELSVAGLLLLGLLKDGGQLLGHAASFK